MWTDLTTVIERRDPRCGWTRHYDGLYVDSQLLAISRIFHAKQQNSVSLSQLLDEMRGYPDLLKSLDGYRVSRELGRALDPKRDKAELRTAVNEVLPWRDQVIAHISRKPRPSDFSWEYLDSAIQKLTTIFKVYAFRIMGANYLVDKSVGTRWHSVFSEALYDQRIEEAIAP
ncbi:MAG TPA: hypothetical protein VHB02_18410 [Acidimicrobiales bacterium]|nr:hypothetical protein [Acidimicrobiales bacterium]